MKEKKTNIENQTFQSIKFLGIEDLNQKYMPNNEMIKYIMEHMFEEFKSFLDKEYNLNERYFPEGLFIQNKIRFVPESVYYAKSRKGKKELEK